MEVRFAARLEEACEALAARVAEARRQRGPLEPVTLWVPSPTVAAFAKMWLARRLGVAAQIQATRIHEGLAALGRAHDPPLSLLGPDVLRGRVLAALHDPTLLAAPALAPLVRWLGSDTSAWPRRRSELAALLAPVFLAYLERRPRWLADQRSAGAAPRTWQLVLLDAVLAGTPALPLPALVERLADGPLPAELHVLGWSILPVGVLDALQVLSRRTQVYVYAPNPSRAMWADPSITRREAGSVLLTESGRALRELVLRLLEQSGYDAGDLPELRPPARTLLEHLQLCLDEAQDTPWTVAVTGGSAPAGSSIPAKPAGSSVAATPAASPPAGAMPGGTLAQGAPAAATHALDRSLVIRACPGIRREVEVVAQQIWQLISQDETLRFDQIAIYYVDRRDQSYATHIDAALEEAHQIPRRLSDTPLSRESPVVGAVLSLLGLPLGHHSRAEVLSVLTHPLVRARWPDVDAEEWLTWCVDAGVVRGLDDEAFRNTYAEGARLYHWDQGLERVALGTLTEGTPLEVGGHLLFPPPIPGTRARAAGRLVLLARSLLADTAWAATAELPLAEWVRFLGELVATYIVPPDEATGAALRACLAAIAARAEVDAGDAPIAYRVAHDLVVEALEGLRSRRGAELAGGVHVAPLRTGAIVPFPVMFVLGLDASRFPTRAAETDLDLRPTRPEDPGYEDVAESALDASPEDHDRAAFMEVLCAARRHLFLSWESRDAVTGEPRAHAAALGHVLRWARAVGAPLTIEEVPLSRTEIVPPLGEAADASLPVVAAERTADKLGQAYAEAFGRRPSEAELRDALQHVAPEHQAELQRALRLVPLPREVASAHAAARELSVRVTQLYDYLACPLQGAAKFALGIEPDDEDDPAVLRAEPLTSARRLRGAAMREVFARVAPLPGASFEGVLAEVTARRRARGEAPSGLFGAAEFHAEGRLLDAWLRALWQFGAARPLSLGSPSPGAGPARILSPLVLQTSRGPVKLVGPVGLMIDGPEGELRLRSREPRRSVAVRYPTRVSQPGPRDALRAAVEHAIATLVLGEAVGHEVLILSSDEHGRAASKAVGLTALSVDRAQAFLTAAVEAMLAKPLDVLFPIEAALQVYRGTPVEDAVEDVREQLQSGELGNLSSRFGPVRDPALHRAPSGREAEALMDRVRVVFELWPSAGGQDS